MLNTLAYLLLLAAFLHAVFFGSRRLLYAAAFFMPMTQVMPNPAGPPSVPINLIMGGLLLALIFHKAKIKPVSGSLPLKGPILFLWSMFLASFAGRTLDEFSGSYYLIPFGAAFRILWYWMAGFLLYVLAYRWIEGKRTVRRIVFLCQASFVGEALLTVIERLSDPGRATAHLEEVNRAGAYFASAGSFFLVWFFLESGGWKRRTLWFGAWLLSTLAVFNTLSRGAMLSLAVTCVLVVLVAFLDSRRSMGVKILFTGVLVLGVINAPFLVPQTVKNRVLHTFGGTLPQEGENVDVDHSSAERLLFWKIGLKKFAEHPLGYGPATYKQLVGEEYEKAKAAHNIYVEVLVEFGFQGLGALLILVIALFWRLWRRYLRSRDPYYQALALSLGAWYTSHSIAHFFVNPYFNVQVTGQFWIMTAALFAVTSRRPDSEPEGGRGSLAARPARRRRVLRSRVHPAG